MKKGFLFFGLIFVLASFTTRAQIYEFYSQDFEGPQDTSYIPSDPSRVIVQSSFMSGGSHACKITHTYQETMYLTLDTIDFSVINGLNYYTLEFMHISFINKDNVLPSLRSQICMIEAKRPDQSESAWVPLNSTHYNRSDGGTTEFDLISSFNSVSYPEWDLAVRNNTNGLPDNTLWKKERFDLEQFFLDVGVTNRKLQIRFTLVVRNTGYTAGVDPGAWYIDDIKVRASSDPIVTPKINVISYPDLLNYPSSRGAKLIADVTTTVTQGIDEDSVYAEYFVGSDTTKYRTYLTANGNRYEGRIPFFGFDTLVRYHIVAKDSTTNRNTGTFPKSSNQYLTYRCVRGKTNSAMPQGTQSNQSAYPFSSLGDTKCEFIYDSTTLANLGYSPGYITSFRFISSAVSANEITRARFQIRMANVSNSYNVPTSISDGLPFYNSPMQIVYDSVLTLPRHSASSYITINLQDTFFYAGSDIIVQMICDHTANPTATAVKHIPTLNNKASLYKDEADANMNKNPFTDAEFLTGYAASTRPQTLFVATKHIPLVHDCGVSALAYPSHEVPSNVGTDSVVVWLKNFGVSPMNAVRLWYRIDNLPAVSYDWTGTLNGGDSVRVKLSSTQTFTIGYHHMTAWVDDSITVGSMLIRDHEPFNDTTSATFAVCDGPYSGVRTVGTGSGADFATLDQCLYVLSRCGIDAPLTIKLPAGNYGITKFPYIPGTSATNHVTFEPATPTSVVTFRRPHGGSMALTWVPSLVDLQEARGIHFRNIRFCNGTNSDNACRVLALLGTQSAHCIFENCQFIDSGAVAPAENALLQANGSDSILITNCYFYGSNVGVSYRGTAADDRSSFNKIYGSEFRHQMNTAISVVNQDNVLVDSNIVYDVRTNASYTVLGQYVYGTSRITRNKVYSTKGSSCIGVSDMHGSADGYGVVANNMMVSIFDGSTNMLTTPLNIIKGSYLKVVFNSVRLRALDFVNVAAATLGGDTISNIYFQNNVIATFDTSNYAFSFIPGDNGTGLHVDHNCYYSESGVLNKLSGTNYHNLNAWRNAVPVDNGSVSGNPNFTNGSLIDLRSFSALLRNVGVPVAEVTDDIFGTTRHATNPSLGAYEVSVLAIDFTPVEFVTPMPDYCGAPATIPVEVAIRNTGNGTYTYSGATPITVFYSIDNGPVQNFTVSRNCGPNDTIHFLSTRTMSLPSGTNNSDRTYNIKWWVKCSLDPDDLNDTSVYTVLSRYAAPAPTVINQNVPYFTAATITPTAGINTWPISYYTSGNGRQQRSGISWYRSMDDTARFHYGPSLTTDLLYDDTTFYISQKRNLPLVKITEVQINRSAQGVTFPLPSYMNSTTNVAIELTNCGDYPANIEGDSVIIIQSNSAAKIWVLPNVTIEPGANLLLQYKTSSSPYDTSRTIYAPNSVGSVTLSHTANFAVIYRDGNGIADAVPFNNVITAPSTQPITWSNQSIPAAVWQGTAINLAQGASTATPPVNTPTAGARRIAWPTNAPTASPTATSLLWQVATDANPMHIGTTEPELIRYFDNGCEGARSAVNVHVTNIPVVDLKLENLHVNEGCDLTSTEQVSVDVHNYGSQAVSSVIVKYSIDGGATVACSDTLANGLGVRSGIVHTFSVPLNMVTTTDSSFHITAWVNANSSDIHHDNDTISDDFDAFFTPPAPVITSPRVVAYNDVDTLVTLNPSPKMATVWLSSRHVPYDTTMNSFITPIIYRPDTFFAYNVALRVVPATQVGDLASVTANNYPSPYNPKTRYVKEQYLVTADRILQSGHGAGSIGSLSFFLESLGNNVSTFTYSYYTIKMGSTNLSVFPNGNFVTGLTEVYNATDLTFTANNIGWVQHNFDTPFQWDGTSNIVIEVTRALSTTGLSNGANTRYTARPNTTITKQNASTDQASQTSGTKGSNLPDMIFGFYEAVGCPSAETAVIIDVTNVPDTDATISWPADDPNVVLTACDSIDFDVVLDNRGHSNIVNYTLHYQLDNGPWQQVSDSTSPLPMGYTRQVPMFSALLEPGLHTITAVIKIPGDSVFSNDTIHRSVNIRFCTNEYIVGTCPGSDFTTINEAIQRLYAAGVAGAVTFRLCEETFNEQVNLGPVNGVNDTNTITFAAINGAVEQPVVMFNPTNASNHVIEISSANYITFRDICFYANYTTGSGNNIFANVAKISGSTNIRFSNCTLRSKKTTGSSTNANILLLGDENHYITIDSCLLDSGYYGVRSLNNNYSDNITITNSDILHFWFQGVNIRNTDTLFVTRDSIASGVTVAGKPLTGIYVANGNHVSIQRNFIYLIDDKNGGKRGISINNCKGTNIDRVTVYNNMISLSGTAVASLLTSGIWIDSLSKFVNVYFNTASIYAGASQPTTSGFCVQRSSNVHVLNNIFHNKSKGYAYYVAIDTCVSNSNFNVYWTNAEPHPTTGVRRFAYWSGTDCFDLDSLRYYNNKDVNSIEEFPYFVAPDNLRLTLAQFADRAQYNPDVTTDVYGKIRPQIPAPTIGAHEFTRLTHNIAIAEIYEPFIPEITTGNNPTVNNIETDSITVRVRFYNSGNAPETGVTWYAYTADVTPTPTSVVRTIPQMPLRTMIEDSVKVPSPLGIIDTQHIVVVLQMPTGIVDNDPSNNIDTAGVFLYPAYDLQLVSIAVDSTVDSKHCRMYQVPLRYTLRNVGKKDFPSDYTFSLGYDYYCQPFGGGQPTPSFPNIPGSDNTDMQSFGVTIPVGATAELVNSLAHQPNLYPTNYIGDITIKLRGFVHYEYDPKPLTDTTNYINITSNHTPEMPIAHDTMVDYGTYGNLWATQNASRPIRWHRDTVSGNFFYNGNNQYVRSTHWSSTPQYFHDSLYYLSCLSTRNCTSYYSQINVGINPPLNYDVSISEVRSPRASGRVYLEKDTVTLRVVNYGSQPISNIPIAFKFMNAAGRITYLEVHDTVRTTIPGRIGDNVSYYDFSFDTALLQINQPLSNTSFTLNAWVYHPDDQQRGNDTLRTLHTFKSLAESKYDSINRFIPSTVDGFDIARVSYNELDVIMPDLIGYDHLWLGNYNARNAEIPTLFIRRGTEDTLTVMVANNYNELDTSTAASLCVAIDYNRDGEYDFDGNENITKTLFAKNAKVRSRKEFKTPLTIPDYAHYGYMRMLVWVHGDSTAYVNGIHTLSTFDNGQMQEYLLFIREDCELDTNDAALTRVQAPRNHIVTENNHQVTIVMANKGLQPITSAAITYRLLHPDHAPQIGTINWAGNLQPGLSTSIVIDSLVFNEGTSNLVCVVNAPGDTLNNLNDTLRYQYHRYFVVQPRYIDSFDFVNKWYAPVGYNKYTRNYFEIGTPAKSNITGPYSQPNAIVTSCTETIVTGKRGNRSVIYSPIVNLRLIKADTIELLLSKDLASGSFLVLEYKNYEDKWVRLDDANARWGAADNSSWYDTPDGWTGSTRNGEYVHLSIPTKPLSGDFFQDLQFRFVYTTPTTTSATAAFGDGAAIDNFKLGRAKREIDPGVIAITHPTEPQFGQTIYPRVLIHNYGLEPISNFRVSYLPYGSYLSREATCTDTIPAGEDLEYEFPFPFTITNNYPDTFQMCAFTDVQLDVYNDNDTACRIYGLAPLANDLYMYNINSPLASAVAGDSLYITVRLRNFGQNEIEDCDLYYIYNQGDTVHEHVHFPDYLGRNLSSTEFFNYTFKRRERATFGTMLLTTWCKYGLDVYPYNDTLSRQIAGITNLTDIRATTGIVDTSDHNEVRFAIVLDNVGASMANDFEVGFYYDRDITKTTYNIFHKENGLAAGERAVYYFVTDTTIASRTTPWTYLTVWLHHPNDTNLSNDTSTLIVRTADFFMDVEFVKIQIEENNTDSCRVRAVIRNNSTVPFDNNIEIFATINGGDRLRSLYPRFSYSIPETGGIKHLDFKQRVNYTEGSINGRYLHIPKSPTRDYVGSGYFTIPVTQADPNNDQSTVVEVVNYFESIPTADNETVFTLEQNYPNPFDGSTSIEFFIPYGGNVRFFVTDMAGRLVYESNTTYPEGRNHISFKKGNLPTGAYYYGVEFDGMRRLHKMIIK